MTSFQSPKTRVRRSPGKAKSHRKGFAANLTAIAVTGLALISLASQQNSQACGLFGMPKQSACSITKAQAEVDGIVGIVGTAKTTFKATGSVNYAPIKTRSMSEQAEASVDIAALNQWQTPASAPARRLEQNSFVAITNSSVVGELPTGQGYEQAYPGFEFQFPRDHASHNQYRTEWWYYNGHLQTKTGKTYGYELTFFRVGGDYEPNNPNSAWKGDNYDFAHFTITDENGKTFFVDEKSSHSKITAPGARSDKCFVHNQDWSLKLVGNTFVLDAHSPEYSIHLSLASKKPPVLHGQNGFCQKSQRTGGGTLYYSMTHLNTNGKLTIGDKTVDVTGVSWMDHEFGSYRLTPEQCGWNWYSIQLDDNRELMICLIRQLNGTYEPASCGTLVDAQGNSRHLDITQFGVTATGSWTSEKSGGVYPMGWFITVPEEGLSLSLSTKVKGQELNTAAPIGLTYWEGAIQLEGMSNGKRVRGVGYAEMTGYCEKNKQSII